MSTVPVVLQLTHGCAGWVDVFIQECILLRRVSPFKCNPVVIFIMYSARPLGNVRKITVNLDKFYCFSTVFKTSACFTIREIRITAAAAAG